MLLTLTLLLAFACNKKPDTDTPDIDPPDTDTAVEQPDTGTLDTGTIDTDTAVEQPVDPCTLPVMPSATDAPLSCGDFATGDPAQGAPINEDTRVLCGYPAGNYATYHVTEPATVRVHFCEPGGRLVVFGDNHACYGTSESPDGMTWGTYPLQVHTIGVTGARYWLEVEC